MSALAQKVAGAAKTVSRGLKLIFKARPYYWDKDRSRAMTREQILDKYKASKWAGQTLSMHLHRVTSGRAQSAWIEFVYRHSTGAPIVALRKAGWTPVITARDAANFTGLSEEAMRVACEECVEL